MKHKRPKSKAYRRLRLLAELTLGGCCRRCGSTKDLHFHHVEYSYDSVHGYASGTARALEVLRHPERFDLLCGPCHRHNPTTLKEKERGRGLDVEEGEISDLF